jgi:hypothetical protein
MRFDVDVYGIVELEGKVTPRVEVIVDVDESVIE